jgi:putative ABC transport system permease protein
VSRANTLVSVFWHEANRELRRYKVRSGLAALGIMIGIAAVALVVGVGDAGTKKAQEALQALGDNLVWVEAGSRNVAGVRTGNHGMTTLTPEDAEAIRNEVPQIKHVSPQVDGTALLIAGDKSWTTRWRGETPEYLGIKRWTVALGRSFTDEEVENEASTLLIGETVRQQLFGSLNPVGETVRINRIPYEVVGVLNAKGQSTDGRDQDDWVLLPWTTAISKIRGRALGRWLDDILCSADAPESVQPAIDRVIALMRQRHQIQPAQDDDFNIRRPDEILKAQVEAKNTLALLLVSIAAVSLIVGGIGIMNMMLASVTERTREIGVRLAIGATELDIQAQFLGEALLLCVVGGALGVALSVGASVGFARFLDWPISLSPQALVLAMGASAAVGVIAGLYPARRAARLDPIEALRHE